MRVVRETARFRKDIKRLQKQNKDLNKLLELVALLMVDTTVNSKYQDHALTGDLAGYRNCHIEPDWIIIYSQQDSEILLLFRTGSHSDLFG